ncbi:MAG: hypothetical protein ACTSP4_09160 [Candidatus Hodarchaeales archaeon]
MNFLEKFQITNKQMGKIRLRFIEKVDRELGLYIDHVSIYCPVVKGDKKRKEMAKLLEKQQ